MNDTPATAAADLDLVRRLTAERDAALAALKRANADNGAMYRALQFISRAGDLPSARNLAIGMLRRLPDEAAPPPPPPTE